MLKQIKLCPSGCQYWNKSVIARNGKLLAYCSTLAIYFLDLDTFTIAKIIAAHDQTITCIAWNPINGSQLASVSMDNLLYIWNLNSDIPDLQLNITSPVLMMQFNPVKENELFFLHENGDIKILNTLTKAIIKKANYAGVRPKTLKFHPNFAGRFALGCNEGGALICEIAHDNVKKMDLNKQSTGSEDVEWDPLSDKYLLVAFKDGSLALFDVETTQVLRMFDKITTGIKSIAWNKSSPGEFFTVTDKIAALKVWNVSKNTPVDTVKLGNSGISLIYYMHDRGELVCTFKSGSVGVYSLLKKKLDFCTEPGHAETVFDISINPNDKNMLATVSYEGTIKIWDLRNMRNIDTLHSDALESGHFKGVMQVKCVLYGLAWGPGTLIAACTAKGDVLLYDYSKTRLLHRFRPSIEAPIYRISWSLVRTDLLAVGTSDSFLAILKLEGKTLTKNKMIKHPQTVYGAVWHHSHPQYIATGCQDGKVRVFNDGELLVEFKAHDGKIFNLAWNPCFDNILATSSDDKIVGVWDVNTKKPVASLRGHTQNTRAIVWNYEIPWILVSGSWDATIRVWDVRTSDCLHVSGEHHADVYGIASHPSRPFLYLSCSRDASIRFWSLEDYVQELELKALSKYELFNLISPPSLDKSAPLGLSGSGSRQISNSLNSSSDIDKIRKIVTFFRFRNGEDDFFDILNFIKYRIEVNTNNTILPVEELYSNRITKANQLETASDMAYLGSSLAKKEDRLKESAKTHLKLGNVKQYCEIMIKLGNWERALAFAPGFCMDYWINVSQRYAQYLANNEKEDASAIYLAGGKPDKAIQFFLRRRDYEDALLVASRKGSGVFTPVPAEGPRKVATDASEDSVLKDIVNKLAEDYFQVCEPVLAAASHLSLRDFKSALNKLVRSHELSHALALCTLHNLPSTEVKLYLARRCEKKGLWETAMEYLAEEPALKELQAARIPDPNKCEIYRLRRPDEYLVMAEAALQANNVKEAIRLFIIGRNSFRAAELTLYRFKQLFESDDLSEIFDILSYFNFANIEPLPLKLKAELLALGSLLGGIQSFWKGYSITYVMLGTYINLLKAQSLDLPVGANIQAIINGIIESLRSTDAAKELLRAVQSNNPNEIESIENLCQQMNKVNFNAARELSRNKMKLIGGNLPSNNANKKIPVSIFTRKPIQGAVFHFGNYPIGLDEALMWAKVNPFSPQNDGSLINPY
jgi:WD repeat-containing protein 17